MRIDYAEIIKSSVSMPEVAERYTGQRIVRNRIRCPMHNGTDRNMRIYPKSYYCWVCHAAGDQIQFVQSVLGLSFQDAMKRLNEDFGLNLPIGENRPELNDVRWSELNRETAFRRFVELMNQIDTELNGMRMANLSGLLNEVDNICVEERPKTPWDEWADDWCEAMRVRTELNEQIR